MDGAMRRLIGLGLALVLLAGGCGGGGSPTTASTATEVPVMTTEAPTTTTESPTTAPTTTTEAPTTTTEAPTTATEAPTTTTEATTTTAPSETTTTAAPIVLTDSFRGVTSETIRIGFTSIDFEKFNSTYGFNLTYANYGPAVDTYVAHVNATGGILGRMIEVIHGTFLPVGAATAEAVCVELAEDHRVLPC